MGSTLNTLYSISTCILAENRMWGTKNFINIKLNCEISLIIIYIPHTGQLYRYLFVFPISFELLPISFLLTFDVWLPINLLNKMLAKVFSLDILKVITLYIGYLDAKTKEQDLKDQAKQMTVIEEFGYLYMILLLVYW